MNHLMLKISQSEPMQAMRSSRKHAVTGIGSGCALTALLDHVHTANITLYALLTHQHTAKAGLVIDFEQQLTCCAALGWKCGGAYPEGPAELAGCAWGVDCCAGLASVLMTRCNE